MTRMAHASAAQVEAPTLLAALSASLHPANLILGAIVLLGWVCLLFWTGAGLEGGETPACANLTVSSRPCPDDVPTKDQSRVAPHVMDFAS